MRAGLDQSVEQMRIESKVRIEEFKKQEEKKLQELITHARLEEDTLWSRMFAVANKDRKMLETDENTQDQTKKQNDHHVRFANQEEPRSIKKSFDLDETAISTLQHIDLNKSQNRYQEDDDHDQGIV